MRKILIALMSLGVFFGIGVGIHAGLVSVADGDGDWSARAQSTCATCHGG